MTCAVGAVGASCSNAVWARVSWSCAALRSPARGAAAGAAGLRIVLQSSGAPVFHPHSRTSGRVLALIERRFQRGDLVFSHTIGGVVRIRDKWANRILSMSRHPGERSSSYARGYRSRTVRVSRRERAAHNSAKMPTILRTKRSAARSVGRHVAVVSVFRARAQPTFLSVSVRAPRDTAHHGAVRSAFRYRFRATQIPPQ